MERGSKVLVVAVGCLMSVLIALSLVEPEQSEAKTTLPEHTYPCTVLRVIDGDTVDVQVPVWGDRVIIRERIRLAGINAPEIHGPERPAGLRAKDWLSEQVTSGEVLLRTAAERGKYGRTLGVLLVRRDGKLVDLCAEMVKLGFAERYER